MADEIIRVNDAYYILATSTRVDDRRRVLKHGDTFAVFDRYGDIENVGPPEFGIYHHDTRFLSRLGLRLGTYRPLLLSSTVKEDNALLTVDLTNPDVAQPNDIIVPRGTLHVFRSKLLWDAVCYDHLRLHNYGRLPIQLSLVFELDPDLVDLFEVRGLDRKRRGTLRAPRIEGNTIEFAYEGLDGHVRRTHVSCDPAPTALAAGHVRYDVRLETSGAAEHELLIRCDSNGANGGNGTRGAVRDPDAANRVASSFESERARAPEIVTSNNQFNDWIQRSIADLHLLRTETRQGAYPYAGIPWFCTPFGRDGIITALQCLWYDPAIARGVLSFLSATQAERDNPEQDAQPGKILHEARAGEMAALSEVPFGRYYGSVDSTPLFVLLAGAYQRRTGDTAFSKQIWPHVVRALEWIDHYGDVDGDGFVEYARRTPQGLVQLSFSGWGVRTVAANEARYNPMSYHNGSVWPHDNSLLAAGLARYGMREEASRVLGAMFDASRWFELHRLPELFCGFHRRPGESPTLYPVSCAPQAWAAGAALLLLQACLGLEPTVEPAELVDVDPFLPPFLREIQINGLRVGETVVDLFLTRRHDTVQVTALRGDSIVRVRDST